MGKKPEKNNPDDKATGKLSKYGPPKPHDDDDVKDLRDDAKKAGYGDGEGEYPR